MKAKESQNIYCPVCKKEHKVECEFGGILFMFALDAVSNQAEKEGVCIKEIINKD